MKSVSVILPVYKVEKYIASALQSVVNQTYQNLEILIVDDGSPDKSVEICQQFTDSRIKIIRQENRGLAGARNTGIRHAQGDYLAFLDGDDLWLPEKIEKHIEHLENALEVGISFSRSAFIDEAGQPLNAYQMPQLQNITPPDLLRHNPIGNGSAGVFRREVFEAIAFPDERHGSVETCYFDEDFSMSQDIECWLRIAIQTPWQLEGIPEALTLYRVNPQAISANLLKRIEIWEKLFAKVRSYAPELMAQWENISLAYRLRDLAREAVRRQVGSTAVQLIHQALATDRRILLKEPRSTIFTAVAAYLLWLLPPSVYRQIATLGAKVTGGFQRQRIHQDLKQAA
jgi:glycosyltransferase involved in cell wall biosynthesis